MARLPTVIVTGSEYPAGLAALRALDRAGFAAWAAVTSRSSFGARSRAAAGVIDVPDARTAPMAFARSLAGAAERLGAAAVLPGTEAALLALAGREDEFPAGTVVGTPPQAAVRRATDKIALALLAIRAGIDVPPTRVAVAGGRVADAVTYPAMVKPLRSELLMEDGLHRFEATRVESVDELTDALSALPDEAAIVQEYIEGRLISVNGVAFDGELHAVNQHVVRRTWPDRSGQAVYAVTIPMTAERERSTAAFIRELGWSGVFNLQIIERDGQDYVIDLNPRFYASLTLAESAGLNMPAIWTSLLLGLPFEDDGYRAGARFRDEKSDPRAVIAAVRRGDRAAARALLPRRGTVHAVFSRDDPRPALGLVEEVARALRRRVARRLR